MGEDESGAGDVADKLRQFPRDVKRGPIGNHVEPFWQKTILW